MVMKMLRPRATRGGAISCNATAASDMSSGCGGGGGSGALDELSEQSRIRASKTTTRSRGNSLDFDVEETTVSGGSQCGGEDSVHPAAAYRETKQLKKIKFLVLLVLIFAVACAVGVYFYVRYQERSNFETQFREDAVKIMASLSHTLERTVGGINALSVNIASHAKASKQEWPFVSVPDFGVRAGKFLTLSKAYVINTYMYVKPEQRLQWENYTKYHHDWVNETIDMQEAAETDFTGPIVRNYSIYDVIFDYDEMDKENPGEMGTNRTGPYYLPWWQSVPIIPLSSPPYNWDLMSWGTPDVTSVLETHTISLSYAYLITYGNDTAEDELNEAETEFVQHFIDPSENPVEPVSDILYPIIAEAADSFNLWSNDNYDPNDYTFGGILAMSFYWRDMIRNILAPGSTGIVIVFSNPGCNPTFSYLFDGPEVVYLGTDDYSDPAYDHLAYDSLLLDLAEYALLDSGYSGAPFNQEYCPFTVKVSPSKRMQDDYSTLNPIIFSVTAGIILVVFAIFFLVYDACVERRQRVVMDRAARSSAIVASVFPEMVSKRLMHELGRSACSSTKQQSSEGKPSSPRLALPKLMPSSLLGPHNHHKLGLPGAKMLTRIDRQIVDVFDSATVMCASLHGFEEWSASRNPTQVFILLENVFQAFDSLAKKRKVFVVETVNNRFVAVAGVPKAEETHALVMAGFAWACLNKFSQLASELEIQFGDGTSELGLRVGLHSGLLCAGVLRVDRSRWQIFGETVNTALQMEESGARNRIHVSHTTANYLFAAGKRHWLTRIEDPVVSASIARAIVSSYWLIPRSDQLSAFATTRTDGRSLSERSSVIPSSQLELPSEISNAGFETKRARLIDCMVKLLLEYVRATVTSHRAAGVRRRPPGEITFTRIPGQTCVDEAEDEIPLPADDEVEHATLSSPVEIPSIAVEQLQKLVSTVASTYRGSNRYHNFEHACFKVMAIDSYLKRIVNPAVDRNQQTWEEKLSFKFPDYARRITSDPIVVFAILFSALIGDADHRGITNTQLCIENEQMAETYREQSVQEQNALDLSWNLLMDNEFADFRACIFANREHLHLFRQVLVNAVLSTDVFDADLNARRSERWSRAFSGVELGMEDPLNCRATAVIEHISQATAFAHTLQTWETYRIWSERLFCEMKDAFNEGRMNADPAECWYQSELELFDEYMIPLAQKLKDCNVFGPSSGDCLTNAQRNRSNWEKSGQAIVSQMVERYARQPARPFYSRKDSSF